MTYEIYRYIFIGGAILAAIMFLVSVAVFFLLRIPVVIGDLTGANARKAIENIRSHNESTGDKTYQTSKVNRERGKLTDKITPSGNLMKNHSDSLHGAMGTEKIGTQRLTAEETTLLAEEQSGNETTLLSPEPSGNETTLLSADVPDGWGETSKLVQGHPQEPVPATEQFDATVVFTVEHEITYIHTSEFIE